LAKTFSPFLVPSNLKVTFEVVWHTSAKLMENHTKKHYVFFSSVEKRKKIEGKNSITYAEINNMLPII